MLTKIAEKSAENKVAEKSAEKNVLTKKVHTPLSFGPFFLSVIREPNARHLNMD